MIKVVKAHDGMFRNLSSFHPEAGQTYISETGQTILLILADGEAVNLASSFPRAYAIGYFSSKYAPCEIELKVVQ